MEICASIFRPGIHRAQRDHDHAARASIAPRRAASPLTAPNISSSQNPRASKPAPCTCISSTRRVSHLGRTSQPHLPGHSRSRRAFNSFKPLYCGLFLALAGAAWLGSNWPRSQHRAALPATPAAAAGAAEAQTAIAGSQGGQAAPVQLTVVAELGQGSPYGVTWGEVLTHTGQRLQWNDPGFRLVVHDAAEIKGTAAAMERLARDLVGSHVTVLIGVQDPTVGAALSDLLRNEPTVVALGSSPELRGVSRLGGRQLPAAPSGIAALLGGLLPGNAAAKADVQVLATVQELFERNTSDDLLFVFLVLINQYVREVPLVANSTKTQKAGMKELQCMVQKCGRQIFSCYADTSCRTALNCLNGCHFNDQVCSYRCIASYESPQLADFSLCILQKHNCLGLSAEIPMTPDPAPLPSFNGQPMTHQLAEDLFIGFLRDPSSQLPASGQELFSWRVFGGKNPAYDYFPCQFQLFYRGKAKNSMWYDPVFMVKTLDGKMVWRRRHYRVKRGTTPGTFHLSVLDNGVTSKEYWRILDCAEDLEWCAFYYSGAAAAAGTSYSGAILGSRSGAWPDSSQIPRIEQALERAGIKMWEVSSVDNSGCQGAPLDPSLMAMAS